MTAEICRSTEEHGKCSDRCRALEFSESIRPAVQVTVGNFGKNEVQSFAKKEVQSFAKKMNSSFSENGAGHMLDDGCRRVMTSAGPMLIFRLRWFEV